MQQHPEDRQEDLLPVHFSWSSLEASSKDSPVELEANPSAISLLLTKRFTDARPLRDGVNFRHYLAKDVAYKRWVWIKLFRPERAVDPKLRGQMRSAATQGLQALHPAILPTYDVVDAGNTFFVVGEPLPHSCSLHEWLSKCERTGAEISTESVLAMIDQVSAALEHLHRHGMAIDLCPHHILRSQDGQFKLIAIGTSAVSDEKQAGDEYVELVPPGQRVTFISGDERHSQYTLAAIARRLLLGTEDIGGSRAPHLLASSIPVGLSKAVVKAMKPNASSRFATLAKFRASCGKKRLPAYLTWTIWILGTAAVVAGLVLSWPRIQALIHSLQGG